MRMRCSIAVILGAICLAAPVHADPRSDIAAKARAAMASYDAMDYDTARKLLNQALAIAKRAKLDRDPIVARVYLDLGIAQLASSDQEAAKVAFLSAAQIDPKIAIDPAYKSAELVRMLDDARAAAGDTGGDAGDECRSLRGIQHAAIEGARRGVAQPIEALIGGDVSPVRVVVMYRPEGAIDFTEARLSRQSGCRFAGTIPAAAMHGAVVHYYIAAYDANNKVLVAKGSSGSPNVLELGSPGALPRAPEPAGRPETAPPEHDTSPAPVTTARYSRIVVAASVGTGVGYVTGKTEGDNVVQQCCLGVSRVVLTPEVRYHLNPQLSIGAVARFGLPLGANIMGHSSLAPAGLVRLGYAFSDSGGGLHVMAELGFGILRNTIQLDTQTPGMDTDIVAQGPLLVGTGIGYTKRLGDSLALLLDLDIIAGIALVDKLGTAIHLNNGVGADMRLGVAVGF
jgi:Tetratricopeptide repeat